MALSQQDQRAFATNVLGYTGGFGGGQFNSWLSQNPNQQNRFNSFISSGSTPSPAATPVSQPAPTTQSTGYSQPTWWDTVQGEKNKQAKIEQMRRSGDTQGYQNAIGYLQQQQGIISPGQSAQSVNGVQFSGAAPAKAAAPAAAPVASAPKPPSTVPGSANLGQSAQAPSAQPGSASTALPTPADFSDQYYRQINPDLSYMTGGTRTNEQNQALARDLGYGGQFGAGGFQDYLMANPTLQSIFDRYASGAALTPAEHYYGIGQRQGLEYAPDWENYFADLFAPLLEESQNVTPALPASSEINFTRPDVMALPEGVNSDYASLDPLQLRTAIATEGTQGGGTDRALQDYYFNQLQRGLISDTGDIGQFDLTPIERNYLQMLGLPTGSEKDLLTALYQEQQSRNNPLASVGNNDLLAYLFS